MKWLLYWHTLKFLKPVQIIGRLSFVLKNKVLKLVIIGKVKNQSLKRLPERLELNKRCYSVHALQDLKQKRFNFLNTEKVYKGKIDWQDASRSKLWLYNLHYFEYLLPLTHKVNAENFKFAKIVIQDWLENNPIGYGEGWEPYPISLRVVNWIFFYDTYFDFFFKEEDFKKRFLNSLYQQSYYLTYFLEKHLQANHLWANVKTLLFAGLFFQEKNWLTKGTRLVRRELEEQILADGGHYERSPMYHALVLMDVLDLLNIIKALLKVGQPLEDEILKLEEMLEHRLPAMWNWLNCVTQPDGYYALFNDCAHGVAPTAQEIFQYLKEVGVEVDSQFEKKGSFSFEQSGYYGYRNNDFYLIIDGGKLGVRYQPGHAHCDFLSYELSVKGKRFIVDSGVGEYLPTELRQKARSMYSHNTLVVNELEQAEIWSAFRMGKRIRPEKNEIRTEPEFEFTGSYKNDLNKELAYWHQRRVMVTKAIEITDQWQAEKIVSVENLIHLNPECQVELNDGQVVIRRNEIQISLLYDSKHVKAELRDWFYVPEFGNVLPTKVLVLLPEPELGEMSYSIHFP